MAAISAVTQKRYPLGNRWLVAATVTIPSISAADEWIAASDLQLHDIEFAVASTFGDLTSLYTLQPNAQGTGEAAGSSPGDLGVEAAASGLTLVVLVIGK